jgi:murein hydrolase activator
MVSLFKTTFTFLFILSTAQEIYSQKASDISSKQTELKEIKNEIFTLEKEIQNKSKKEKETFTILQNYDKQSFLLNKVIVGYRKEEKEKENQIAETEQKINSLEKEISRLQTNYAKYVNAVYRKGKQSNLAAIFDSESISQALRRMFYLKKFSERREKDLIGFEKNKGQLVSAKIQLGKEKEEKSFLVEKKMDEEKLLDRKANERKIILSAIRKDKNELKKELDAKKKAESTIRNLITKLTEEKAKRDSELKEKLKLERENELVATKKKKELSKEKTKPLTNKIAFDEQLPIDFSSFQNLKGKLNWPVNNGRIIKKFGENRNLILNTITLNYGVDIKITSDLKVRTVADGVISAIEWIPGYGSIVIISHKDDYRTVYSHLQEIYMQEGDAVRTGQTIASVGESIEGNVLHFEIWSSRTNQNPEIWLAKK